MTTSLADTLDVVCPAMLPPLVSADGRDGLRSLARLLPASDVGGFEVNLAHTDAVPDVALYAPRGSVLNDHIGSDGPLRPLVRAMSGHGPLGRSATDLWLEYDSGGDPTRPSVFLGTSDGRAPEVLRAATRTLAASVSPQTVSAVGTVAAALPPAATVFQVGLMPSRPVDAVRVCLAGLRSDEIVPLLRRLGRDDVAETTQHAVDILRPLVDSIGLSLDVGRQAPSAVGIEGWFAPPKIPALDERWATLLTTLVQLDLAPEGTVAAADTWCGTSFRPPSGWPGRLAVADAIAGPRADLCILRGLHHVKLVARPDRCEAKLYFGFRTTWVSPTATLTLQPTTPVERGLSALATLRNPGGWWEDFQLVAGRSDEWVTAWVGAMLARMQSEDAHELARSAWVLLARRRTELDGWGYNAVVPPDADSTAWALRLASVVGDGNDDRVQRARALLSRHFRPGGGVATYDEPGPISQYLGAPGAGVPGWTHPHVEVTAAVVAALSGRDEDVDYLERNQRADGSWSGYWWEDAEVTTGIVVDALFTSRTEAVARGREWLRDRLRSRLTDGADDAFVTAWCVLGLGAHVPVDLRARARNHLLETQLESGLWTGTARLVVPLPTDSRGGMASQPGTGFGGKSLDDRGAMTTATALAALAALGER